MRPKKVLQQLNIVDSINIPISNTSTELNKTRSKIKQIIHISDIHIRHGDMEHSRYEEYRHVFTNFVAEIACLECVLNREVLFVITGNIFHGKGKLDTPAIKLYFELMDRLLSFGSVIMICGNHEYRKDDLSHPDMLETMIIPYNKLHSQSQVTNQNYNNKLVYLKHTGYYVIDHIGFGVKSISTNDTFPKPSIVNANDVDINIALYHGSIDVHNSECFNEYDYVLLGNNSYQFVDNSSRAYISGYPGTFIQQEYVDSYLQHGFLQWDISSKNIIPKSINIENDYSMIILKKVASDIKIVYNVNGKKNIVNFDITTCPKQPRIKAIGFNTNDTNTLIQLLELNNIKPVFITYANSLNDDTNSVDLNKTDVSVIDVSSTDNNTVEPVTLTQLNCPNKWLEYISGVCHATNYDFIEKIMNNPEMLLLPISYANDVLTNDIKDRISNRNKKISDALAEYNNFNVNTHTTTTTYANNQLTSGNNIYFKVLKWSYIMCYGESNYFDFEGMSGKFALLNGRNAMGKSAFLDVLCIALYGEPSKHRNIMYGKQNNGKIINNTCPANKNMCVDLSFTVNDIQYEISRTYTYTKIDTRQGLKCVNASIKNMDTVLCDNITEVNDWINTIFGSLDNLLMSSFITQIETNNFFNLKQEEQKQVLDSALHLESISSYSKIIRESSLGYNDIINTIKSNIDIINNMKGTTHFDKTQKEIEFVNEMLISKQRSIKENRETYNILLSKVGNIDDFKTVIEFLKTNDITANKKLAKLKRKLETNEFNSITEQDKLYCSQLIDSTDDTNSKKYKQLRFDINNLQDIINSIEKEIDISEITINNVNNTITLESVIKTLNNLENSKITLNMSDELFTKKQKQINTWNLQQKRDEIHLNWLENPDYLDILRNEKINMYEEIKTQYEYLLKNSLQKPQLETIPNKPTLIIKDFNLDNITIELLQTLVDSLNINQISLNELYKNKIIVVKSEKDYAKWLNTYNDWVAKFSAFINADEENEENETIEELEKELEQTIIYRDSILKKLYEKEALERDLVQIDTELINCTNIPYNETCWACKQQPMRIRHNQITENKSQLLRSISKINKYLEKINSINSINTIDNNASNFACLIEELNSKIEELHTQIALQKEYIYSVDIKTSEYEFWQEVKLSWKQEKQWNIQVSKLEKTIENIKCYRDYVQYTLWKSWKSETKLLNNELTELTTIIKDIDMFIKEYEQISEIATEIDKEIELRNKCEKWKKSYNKYTNYKKYFETRETIIKLNNELSELNGSHKINSDLIEKVKVYIEIENECKLLERYILYENGNKTLDAINTDEAQLNNLRERLILLKKELDDAEKYNEKIQSYTSFYDVLIHTRTYINILEDLFIGSTANVNGENTGYKEWVYKTHVIPLIQTHINSFLGLIDNISLEIIYTNKTFQYVVHDRNNTPNLSMTSGYQRFIIGLALRIAFAKIGAVGQNIKHLFIDEGFVACDIYNLDKVNMILKAIHTYGGYDSIMLMSHLDSIRSAADICINIKSITDICGITYSQIHFAKEDIHTNSITNTINNDTLHLFEKHTEMHTETNKIMQQNAEPLKKTRKRSTKNVN